MRSWRTLYFMAVAAAAFMAAGVGTAAAEPVAGCGNGFDLVFSPAQEAIVADSTQGHVNGDG